MRDRYVIIRCRDAGVHAGELVRYEGRTVHLRNTRRIWYWSGAESLSELALFGAANPRECKFAAELPEITLLEACEIIPCSPESEKMIRGCQKWVAS